MNLAEKLKNELIETAYLNIENMSESIKHNKEEMTLEELNEREEIITELESFLQFVSD